MFRRRPKRPLYFDFHIPFLSRKTAIKLLVFIIIFSILYVSLQSILYLRELSATMAVSDATDLMILCINDTIQKTMDDEQYDFDNFVTLEKDESGNITAVVANMARINSLSASLLQAIVNASDSGELNINIPIGNILGSSLLLGKGPEIPVDITMLTSSHVDLINEMAAEGINQIKHQIKLNLVIEVDIILPWETRTTEVLHEVLIAETIIVGAVPETYFNMG